MPDVDIPLPGRPVRGSDSGEPIMALLDLLGRRWALRVIWELRDGEPVTFRALQERCGGISSSVLTQRTAELRAAGAIEDADGGYRLSAEGHELLAAYPPLAAWSERWKGRVSASGPRKLGPADDVTRCAHGSAAAR